MPRLLLLLVVCAFVCARPAEAQTGTISGVVTRASNSAPVADVFVWYCDSSSTCNSTNSGLTGAYTITANPGTYYLFTYNTSGLIDEIFDNITCPGVCSYATAIATGTPVVITSGGSTPGRNFALADGGSISGSIRNAATSLPLAGVAVLIYMKVGEEWVNAAETGTDGAGVYTASGLPTGTYYAHTFNNAGFVNEVYDNVQCPGQCGFPHVDTGTPIPVTAGLSTPNRDFLLSPGGAISGTVVNNATSAPLPAVTVYAVLAEGASFTIAGYGTTNASGAFSIMGLPTGTYQAFTVSGGGFVNEYYENVPCIGGCQIAPPAGATPIAVTAPAATSGRNFRLDLGASITGTVVNSSTAAPVSGVLVRAHTPNAAGGLTLVRSTFTNASGAYTLNALPTGSYYVSTSNSAGLLNEVFDDIQCGASCNTPQILGGTAVAVTVATTTPGKNFSLEPGGVIAGTVLALPGNTPIPNSVINVYTRAADGDTEYVAGVVASPSGAYEVKGLPSGTYWAYNENSGYTDDIHSGVPCLGSCISVVSSGTPISVTAGQTTGNINFSPRMGGRISGVVYNAATSTTVPGAYVTVFRSLGSGIVRQLATGVTNAAGAFTIGGLNTGDYFVATSVDRFDNQIHAGISCAGLCSSELAVARGTPVPVSFNSTVELNFSLNPSSGRIAGTVTDAATSAPLNGMVIFAYSSGTDHHYAGSGFTNALGAYEIRLPPGTYHLVALNTAQYQGEIFDNIPCLSTCWYGAGVVTAGAPVVVTTGTATANFALQPVPASLPGPPDDLWGRIAGGTVRLEWYPLLYGGAATDYVLEAGFSPGATALSIVVPGTTFQTTGVPPGRYFVRVRGRNALGLGPPSGEFEVAVNADGSGVPGHPEGLEMYVEGNRLFGDWSEPWYGGFPTGYVLEAGTAKGLSNLATVPVGPLTHFELSPVPPPGVYFVRVRGRNALSLGPPSRDLRLVIGGVPAPPDAPGNFSLAVDTARRVTVAWTAPRGTVTGYILEVGSASMRFNLGAFPLPASSTVFNAGVVPPGLYFVRIRAVNASGAGVASSERMLYVP